MPCATKELQREYQRKWMARRRAEYFADKHCLKCDRTDNLEIHHRDPSQKISHRIWSWSKKRREEELKKCDVLCADCHPSNPPILTGEKNGQCKLSDKNMILVKTDLDAGLSCRKVARKYNVAHQHISRIRRGFRSGRQKNCQVGQSVDQWTVNPRVGGSSPPLAATLGP